MGIHLAYLTYNLAQHPWIQNRLRLELHSTTTTNSLRSLDSLPLLEAVILETHRLTPSISGPLPRVTPPQGCQLAGFFIPGGVRVSGQAYSLHKEERVFGGDAGEWRPDRWLGVSEEKGKEMRRWMWQFGGGGRGCLGQHFATLRKYHLLPLRFVSFQYQKEGEHDLESWRNTQLGNRASLTTRLQKSKRSSLPSIKVSLQSRSTETTER